MARKMMKIDGDKFKDALYRKGITCKAASEALGYSPAYLSIAMKNGKLSEQCVKLINSLYGINYMEYGYLESIVEKETQAEETAISEIEQLRNEVKSLKAILSKMVYDSTKDAMEDAFSNCKDDLYLIIRNAFVDALEGEGESE